MSATRWAILCISHEGRLDYLMRGGIEVATFPKREAREFADQLRDNVGADYQSVNVVRAPRPTAKKQRVPREVAAPAIPASGPGCPAEPAVLVRPVGSRRTDGDPAATSVETRP